MRRLLEPIPAYANVAVPYIVPRSFGKTAIEVGKIGREGMVGIPVVLGNGDRFPNEIYMQVAGSGQRMSAKALREAIAASVMLHQVLLHSVHSFMTQTTQTALANGRSKIEERLARWLLLAHDRIDGDKIPLPARSRQQS